MERRDILRGVTLCATISSASLTSACSYASFDDDEWAARLINFLRDGDQESLSGLFKDFSTLVSFSSSFVATDSLAYIGENAVRSALVGFRETMTRKGWVEPRRLADAKIVGSEQQGRMNKIELLFAETVTSETSCGPSRSEWRVDLYYEAGVHEAGDDYVKWAIERIALMPALELERFP